jgi:hypothetical protein
MTEEQLPLLSKFRERLKWIVPVILAIMLVCFGCFFFVAVGLVARGELTTSALGTDFRLWSINDRTQTGVGFQRSFGVRQNDKPCTHFDITFLLWKPGLTMDNKSYDDCG